MPSVPPAPRVFLSYSHDSPDHRSRVLALAERLRASGIDATLDQYLEPAGPPEGWPRWMDAQLRTADFVLAVCSATYRARVEGREAAGKGHGVAWEGKLIYQHIYNAGSENSKFVPVLLGESSRDDIPLPLQDVPDFRPEDSEGYQDLYRRLIGEPSVRKGELGVRSPIPSAKVALPGFRSPAAPRIRRLLVPAAAVAVALAGFWLWNRPPAEYHVQVSVVDPNGSLVRRAQVTSSPDGVKLESESGWRLTIPASAAPGGRLTIRAAVPETFQSGEANLQLGRSSGMSVVIRLHALPRVRVSGIVRDSRLRALAGARVSIAGFQDFVVTGADGAFDLPAHAAQGQQVRLNVEKNGYAPAQQDHPAGNVPAEIILDR